jgi:aerobic carbon-monoxide dehydrogenase large subunit
MSRTAEPPVKVFGQPVLREEDNALVQGMSGFVADLPRANALHAVLVRSMHAHGTVRGIDTGAALGLPGVVAVFTAQDLPRFVPLPVNPVCPCPPFPNPILSDQTVFYVGQPLALVVAETAEAAVDGAELVRVDIAPLPPVVGIAQARSRPAIFAGWESNRAYRQEWQAGSFDTAAQEAAIVIEVQVETSRLAPTPLEPRGLLVQWQDSRLICHLPSQAPHRARQTLRAMLGLQPDQLHVVCPQVGGAFGGRASLYPEEVAVTWAAWHLKRSVFWQSTRSEDLISATHGRASELKGWAAFSANGRLLGLRAALAFDLGSWAPFSALIPGWNAGRILPGPYAVPVVEVASEGFVTNTAAVGIYRGAGRPEAALLIERLMDEAARRFAIDPLEIRGLNLAPDTSASDLPDLGSPTPVRSATGLIRHGGQPARLLAQAARHCDYTALKTFVAQEQACGKRVGLGINLYVEPCGSGWESATVTALPSGRFRIASGSSSQGQGHATAFAQIAAEVLGVSPEQIEVIEGDSRITPEGIGALASRSMAIGGSAVFLAAQKLAGLLQDKTGGASASPASKAQGIDGLLQGDTINEEVSVTEVYTTPAEAWSAGCCIAVVEVEPSTGQVHLRRVVWVDDCGAVINPLLVDGQLTGGFAQGVGETLHESIVYDEGGQILTGSLMDYGLARADDLIPLEIFHLDEPMAQHEDLPGSRQEVKTTMRLPNRLPNPLGVSGVGESGSIAAPAALANAVMHALSADLSGDQEITRLRLPLKPEAIWRMIHKKQ